MKAWLGGCPYVIEKALWENGRMGNEIMNYGWKNGRLKILRGCIEGISL